MYPRVRGEIATVERLIKGMSIARFGDGELKILDGRGYSREPTNARLTEEMLELVADPAPDCLIGIPTMDPAGPKYTNWLRHRPRFCRYFSEDDGRRYYSAFITRPDSAADPLESREYVGLLSSLWAGRSGVVVMSEPTSKLLACVRATAAEVTHIECPSRGAYSVIRELEAAIVAVRPSIALLSCGPTATCLANRLARRGVQAVDLGSVGGLLLRWTPSVTKSRGIQ
jgi:hypothetical protein